MFFSAEDVSEVTTVVHGKIMGVEMPFILQNPNACEDSGLKCPLTKDSTYQYMATLPVLKSYPKVSFLSSLILECSQSAMQIQEGVAIESYISGPVGMMVNQCADMHLITIDPFRIELTQTSSRKFAII